MRQPAIARRLLALPLLLLLPACGPWGPQGIFAGGPFLGRASQEPVADWSFTDRIPLVAIETRGAWLRHTVTILCVQDAGRLYVMARHAPRKHWVHDVEADPRVRLAVGGTLYAGRAVRVQDPAEADAVARALLRKYVGLEAPGAHFLLGAPAAGDDRAELWVWRIEPPEPAA